MAPPIKKTHTHGEDFLVSVNDLDLRLENGETVRFNFRAEVAIPDDPDEQRKELMRAPARLLFFAYQAERALGKLRSSEAALAEAEGNADLIYRRWYEDDTNEEYTEQMVRSRVAMDSTVKSAKIHLNHAKICYGYLRALRESLNHRVYVLNAMVGQMPNANRG